MLKKLARTLGLTSLLLSATTQALPIVQADAFITGDNKAALETSTGLVWMDFGVTNGKSLLEVEGELSTTFAGWRLATESEVKHLASDLFAGLSGWNPDAYGSGWGGTSNYDGNFLADIFAVWGYSGTDNYWYFDDKGAIQDRPVVWSQARFRRDDGMVAELYFGEGADTGAGVKNGTVALWGEHISWPEDASYFALGTLLVKSSSVPEPSPLILLGLSLLGLGVARRRRN